MLGMRVLFVKFFRHINMKYNFAFYTGYGYRGVAAHTIHAHYLGVNADNDQEAITKITKKAPKYGQYNDCFYDKVCGVEIISKDNKKIGICFIEDQVIRWVGDTIWKSPIVFGPMPSKDTVWETDYVFSGNWVVTHIFGDVYPTLEAYARYVYEYMNHDAFGETAEERLKKYYYPLLKKIEKIKQEECPQS